VMSTDETVQVVTAHHGDMAQEAATVLAVSEQAVTLTPMAPETVEVPVTPVVLASNAAAFKTEMAEEDQHEHVSEKLQQLMALVSLQLRHSLWQTRAFRKGRFAKTVTVQFCLQNLFTNDLN